MVKPSKVYLLNCHANFANMQKYIYFLIWIVFKKKLLFISEKFNFFCLNETGMFPFVCVLMRWCWYYFYPLTHMPTCAVWGGGGSSNTQSNLIAPYYWESFSVPMCLMQTHWYSLSRSYSTSTGRGRCRMEKGGTYSCLLLTIPYPTCEGWCQATTLVMHITEAQTASGDFVCACMRFCCNAF